MSDFVKLTKLQMLRSIYKDPERKSIPRIMRDLSVLLLHFREIPRHYFTKYMFKTDVFNIRDYMPGKLTVGIVPFFNDKRLKEVLDNKLYFDLFFRQFDINLPRIVLYNHNRLFISGNSTWEINNIEGFCDLLDEIFRQRVTADSLFIKKTYSGSKGEGVFKLFRDQVSADSPVLNEIYRTVIKSEFIFQETIEQHPQLNRISSSSLNTIRIDTFIENTGNVSVISAYLRMSIRESLVDNVSSGGCMVGINLEKGTLKEVGYSIFKYHGSGTYSRHPVSGISFEGFPIPCIREVIELVSRTAALMPGLRLVGWDVAIGKTGPVLIEGNSDYIISGSDLTYGGYMANPVIKNAVKEMHTSLG